MGKYCAVWAYAECEEVSGGVGETIEDAINDYFQNHADDEMDYMCAAVEIEFELQVYSTFEKEEALKHYPEECFNPDWEFMLNNIVKKVPYIARYSLDGWNYYKKGGDDE